MSNEINEVLFERAAYCIDQLESHPAGLDKSIIEALDSGDLERLVYAVGRAEACLAQEEFEAADIL
jgi:hypothetical protein